MPRSHANGREQIESRDMGRDMEYPWAVLGKLTLEFQIATTRVLKQMFKTLIEQSDIIIISDVSVSGTLTLTE